MAGTGSEIRNKNRFHVFYDENNDGTMVELGSFKTVGGLALETDVTEWKTGDMDAMRKLPGTTKYPPVTLHRGFDTDTKLKDWYDAVWNLSNGAGAAEYRKTVIVYVVNRTGTVFKKIRVEAAWPSKYQADDLDGMSSDPWLEQVELQHAGWDYEPVAADEKVPGY